MEQYRRRLPHAYANNTPVFITWRLKFTLPIDVVKKMSLEKEKFEKSILMLSEDYQNMQRYQFSKKQFDLYDDILGCNQDLPQLLTKPEIASIIQDSFNFLDGKKYSLHASCIMSNHVHLLLTPLVDVDKEKQAIGDISHSLKRFTAREINKLLGKDGSLWANESYDHLVRNEKEYVRIGWYIINNPVKAGLVDDWKQWKFTWLEDDLRQHFSS
ncbi:MAG: transposase [Candidatus Cloacimonetes bacterium]|nr:transposase [Candidatus Cloacimonadota bacterium]